MLNRLHASILSTILILPVCHAAFAGDVSVIPRPAQLQLRAGLFTLNAQTTIHSDDADTAMQLRNLLSPATGFNFPAGDAKASNALHLRLSGDRNASPDDEKYILDVTPDAVTISADNSAGLYFGVQTLRQLLPVEIFASQSVGNLPFTVPAVHIEDGPKFHWRGLMMDSCRHFMPKDFVLRFIDLMAIHKFNTFHWHLSDDEGWRIEIKKYPKLTEVGAWRKESVIGHPRHGEPAKYDGIPHGGFYTQDDIRQVVAYAAQRHITIVPEIEMPGHSRAAIASYPQLGTTGEQLEVATRWGNSATLNVDDATIAFYQDVLSEVIELFPSKFIHVGGDEVVQRDWNDNPKIQQRMKELGLKDAKELQGYFMEKMDTFLTSKGRRMIGWDEILYGHLAPGATVMSWRGMGGGITAAKAGHDVVMAPTGFTYLDYYQSPDTAHEPLAGNNVLPLEKVYSFSPIPAELNEEQAKHILGGQGQLWAEFMPNPKQVEYMAYPRACALAEVLWSGPGHDFAEFHQRLQNHLRRLTLLDVNFRPLDPYPPATTSSSTSPSSAPATTRSDD